MGGGGGIDLKKAVDDTVSTGFDIVRGADDFVQGAITETGKGYHMITGESAREQEKQEKKAAKKAKALQARARKDYEAKEKLAGERSDASKDRATAIGRQGRRGKKSGRRSTILTDNLGEVGGEENQGKKSLLGL